MESTASNGDVDVSIPYMVAQSDHLEVSYQDRLLDKITIERPTMRVRDVRAFQGQLSLDEQGFRLIDAPNRIVREKVEALIAENRAPSDVVGPVTQAYLDELAPKMLEISGGAREVIAQYGTAQVRFSARASQRSWMTTAQFAHLDFESTEIDRLLEQTLTLSGRSVAPFRRQAMLQAWRVLTPPPQDNLLAMCDGRTVSAADIVTFDFHGPKGSRNELIRSRAARYNPRHEWYYFPRMTPDEVLIFKGFDSDSPEARNAMHTAFDLPESATAVPRGSIECRFIALYD